MTEIKEPLIVRKDDYELIASYLKGILSRNSFDRHNAEELNAELRKAKLVTKDNFPADVVRLNSKVKIKDETGTKVLELMLVIPERADIKQRKVSVMSPIGTALIGYRKGQKVKWRVPSGLKTFTILDVSNYYQ
jgi:regulator of nucleoside diphosphate kinase